MISVLTLLLTADCNLKCSYCYENSKKRRNMEWPTLRAALDLGMNQGCRGVKIIFSGGEPLLQFPLMQRAVGYVRDRAPSHLRPKFVLLTNGTLLDEGKILFLKENNFDVQLSFDGVEEAQNLRGRGTLVVLDRLLELLSRTYPGFYRCRVKVSMTVTPRTVSCMTGSVKYFLRKGVQRIAIAPSLTDCSDWRPRRIEDVKRQFARISRASLTHYRKTGRIPVLLLRGNGGGQNPVGLRYAWIPGLSMTMCGAMQGKKLAVDVDGEVSACVTLAGSYQRFRSPLLREAAGCMRLGNVRSRSFKPRGGGKGQSAGRNSDYLPLSSRCPEIFLEKEDKHSCYRNCRDCRYFSICLVCPVSIAHARGKPDPRRVPDFACAFNFAAARQWEMFRRKLSIEGSAPS